MEEYSYTSTHPLGHTGPVTGTLYLYLFTQMCLHVLIIVYIYCQCEHNFGFLTFEDGTDTLSQNVCKELPLYAA
jgi:hypothetical protein